MTNNDFKWIKIGLIDLFLLFNVFIGFAQTPGLILKPATTPGIIVLDPDGDGYVSAKTNGVQLGFTNPPDNDVKQSEMVMADYKTLAMDTTNAPRIITIRLLMQYVL